MKKEIVLVFCILISLSFVSASFKCPDDSELEVDSKEIDVGKSKNINGLRVGVTSVDEVAVLNRFFAEIITNSVSISMTNESSEIFEISDKE